MASFRQKISRTKFIFTNVSHQSLYCDRTLRVIHCHWLQQWSRDVRAGLRRCSVDYAQPHDLKAPDATIRPAALVPEPPEIDAPSVEPCPSTDEVDAVAFDEKFQRALDLGCEHDVDGDITFTEPEFEAQLAHR